MEREWRAAGLPVQIGYGAGQIAGQVFRDLPSLLLLYFLTTVVGAAPAVDGAVILAPKMIMGLLCDLTVGTSLIAGESASRCAGGC